MIHILQTGDLHLGKFFYGTSLIEDQKDVLSQIIKAVEKAKKNKPYNAIIITGDVYDKSVPSTEAIEIFDDFLINLHKIDSQLKILIISGNHDSGTRLSFGSKFLEKLNIYICSKSENLNLPVVIEGSEIKNDKEDFITFYQIPFLNSGSLCDLKTGARLTTQNELINEAARRIKETHKNNETLKNSPMCLNAHLFTLGSIPSDSERIFIGNAELIDKKIFNDFTYVALGHLHKKQKVSDNCYYAGSPLAYSFDEGNSEKAFLDIFIDSKSKQTLIEEIKINPLHNVTKLTGKFEDFFRTKKEEILKKQNDYIEITFTDEVLIENPVARLKEFFPNLLSIKQDALTKVNEKKSNLEKRKLLTKNQNIDNQELFENFLLDVQNPENIDEWKSAKKLFCEITKKINEE